MEHLVPEKIRNNFEEVHQLETTQYLRGLGYLVQDRDPSRRSITNRFLQEATEQFRNELLEYQSTDPYGYDTLLEDLASPFVKKGYPGELSSDELHILKELASSDGAFRVSRDVLLEQTPLLRRVLQFRLRFLFKLDGSEGQIDIRKAMAKLKDWLGVAQEVEVFNLLGDLAGLTAHLLSSRILQTRLKYGVVFFSWTGAAGSKKAKQGKEGKEGNPFLRALQPHLSQSQFSTFENEVVLVSRGKVGKKDLKQDLSQLSNQEFNRFLLQLVRVRLWAEGFLSKLPKGAWDKKSQKALESMLEKRLGNKEDMKSERERLQLFLAADTGAFNLYYLWGELAEAPSGEEQDEESQWSQLAESAGKNPKEDVKRIMKEFQEGLMGLPGRLKEQLQQGPSASSWPRFTQPLRQFSGKSESIWNSFEEYCSKASNAHQKLQAQLKQALKLLDNSLEMLLNPTGFETMGIATRFTPSYDAVHFVPPEAEPFFLNNHLVRLQIRRIMMERSAQIVSQLVRWSVQLYTGTISWMLIALQLAKYLAKQIMEWKRENSVIRKSILELGKKAVEEIEI